MYQCKEVNFELKSVDYSNLVHTSMRTSLDMIFLCLVRMYPYPWRLLYETNKRCWQSWCDRRDFFDCLLRALFGQYCRIDFIVCDFGLDDGAKVSSGVCPQLLLSAGSASLVGHATRSKRSGGDLRKPYWIVCPARWSVPRSNYQHPYSGRKYL